MSIERDSLFTRIKRECRIEQVVKAYVREVWPCGEERMKCRCLCGSHPDRHPSVVLYLAQDRFWCFACNRGGSVIDLVMLVEGLEMRSACERLRDRYLIDLPSTRSVTPVRLRDPPQQSPAPTSDEAKAILGFAVAHYQHQLNGAPRTLLYARGLTDDTITQMRIGFADGLSLMRALHQAGHRLSLAQRIGLLSADGQGERLCERIVFPIFNASGDPVFLIGRATLDQQSPKYLGLVNGLARKQPLMLGVPIQGEIVVEGPMDAAALAQWGLAHTYRIIAMLGTAHQATLTALNELAQRQSTHFPIYIALDQDIAGRSAALKLALTLREHDSAMQVQVLVDRDRHRRIRALARQGDVHAQHECGLVKALIKASVIHGVHWGEAKDPGELLGRGESGQVCFVAGLSSHKPAHDKGVMPVK